MSLLNQSNGTFPRCSVQSCHFDQDILVRGYCEEHARILIRKYDAKRIEHLVEADKWTSEISRINQEIKEAKVKAGITNKLPFMSCHNPACNFKSQYWNTIQEHERYCAKRMKEAAKAQSKPRAPSKPKAPQGLTEDDLT